MCVLHSHLLFDAQIAQPVPISTVASTAACNVARNVAHLFRGEAFGPSIERGTQNIKPSGLKTRATSQSPQNFECAPQLNLIFLPQQLRNKRLRFLPLSPSLNRLQPLERLGMRRIDFEKFRINR